MKIAYPLYQLFKSRIETCLFKDIALVHKPIPKSITRVKKEMEKFPYLCPPVLDLHFNNLRSGTNRYLNLIEQGYEGSLFYRAKNPKEAKFMQVVNVMTLRYHPYTYPFFIFEKEIFEKYGQDINIVEISNLLTEHNYYKY